MTPRYPVADHLTAKLGLFRPRDRSFVKAGSRPELSDSTLGRCRGGNQKEQGSKE